MKTIHVVAVAALLALPAFADLSPKYQEWAKSPEAYFMTKADRDQWAAIKTDAEAEAFVKQFIAVRGGPAFQEEVAKRAAIADKYMTVGKTPASMTLRGKVIIVLGPPSSFNIGTRANTRSAEGTVSGSVAAAGGDGKGNGNGSLGDMNQAVQRGMMESSVIHTYDIGYTAEKLPASYGKPLSVSIDVDTGTGKERLDDRKVAAELDTALEAAAAASVKK